MIAILSWIVFGLVIGCREAAYSAILRLHRDGPARIAGALVGGFPAVCSILCPNQAAGYIMSILGAIVLLAVYRAVARRSA